MNDKTGANRGPRRAGVLAVAAVVAVLTAGCGGEVAAWAAEHCFTDLDAPIRRVAATDTHVAYEPTLEQAILPQVDDIARALRALCAF